MIKRSFVPWARCNSALHAARTRQTFVTQGRPFQPAAPQTPPPIQECCPLRFLEGTDNLETGVIGKASEFGDPMSAGSIGRRRPAYIWRYVVPTELPCITGWQELDCADTVFIRNRFWFHWDIDRPRRHSRTERLPSAPNLSIGDGLGMA